MLHLYILRVDTIDPTSTTTNGWGTSSKMPPLEVGHVLFIWEAKDLVTSFVKL